METIVIEHEGEWWKFVIPESASDQTMDFFPAGYSGRFYGVQACKDGSVIEHVDGKGGGPDHNQYSGVLKDAYLWFWNETVVKGTRVKMGKA
jgi:hypothetical protein